MSRARLHAAASQVLSQALPPHVLPRQLQATERKELTEATFVGSTWWSRSSVLVSLIAESVTYPQPRTCLWSRAELGRASCRLIVIAEQEERGWELEFLALVPE